MTNSPTTNTITCQLVCPPRRLLSRRSKGSSGSLETKSHITRIPRIARLMALAIHCDQLIRDGQIADQAMLARVGRISRARVSQIFNLLNLAPDMQESLLFLTHEHGRAPVILADLQSIANERNWESQRVMWTNLYIHKSKVGREVTG